METPRTELNLRQFESRKKSHLDLALDPRSQALERNALVRVRLKPDPLPEMNFADVEIGTLFQKKKLATPFYVSGMTAGHASAVEMNRRLAAACARRGWIFGVGSQRRELAANTPAIDAWSGLRETHPDLVLMGNLGLSQVIGAESSGLKKLVKNLGANAFAVHLNALQEVMQPEGTPNFKGGLAELRRLARGLGVPLILKETGCGFSEKSLRKLRGLPLFAVDVSGLGGTHWGRIEGFRAAASGDTVRAQAAETFADWGTTTVDSVQAARRVLAPSVEIWASGGVRSGLDAAKLIALGAHRVGFAKPALEAALSGEEALDRWMERMEFELKTALFCAGYDSVKKLRKTAVLKKDVVHED